MNGKPIGDGVLSAHLIEIDRHYFSVPYQLAGQQLEARYTATSVELFQVLQPGNAAHWSGDGVVPPYFSEK